MQKRFSVLPVFKNTFWISESRVDCKEPNRYRCTAKYLNWIF